MRFKFRRFSVIILTVLICMSFASARSTSDFSIDYVSSDVVEYGDVLTVMGSGITAGSTINIYWDYVTVAYLLNTTIGLPSGEFECEVNVPSTDYGDHYLWAKDLATGLTVRSDAISVVPDTDTCEIPLFVGWNLVGLPCMPEDPSIEVVLSEIIYYVECVWTFDGEAKTWSSYSPGAPSNLAEIVDDKGYWIKVNTDAILTIHIESTEGIVTEVDSELGTNCFVYSTDDYQIAVILPTYLEASTPYSKYASEIDVYLKPLVSLSGLFSVDVEAGIKIKIPAFSIWTFIDVDLTWLGEFEPDIFCWEYPAYGLSTALDLDEGDVGIYALSIPTMAGAVIVEDLPIGEWSYVASYDVYTVMEPTLVSLGLTADDIIIGPVSESTEETTTYFIGSINSDVYHTPTCYHVDSIHEDNKIYFSSAEEAEIAGYRACLVCTP